MKPYEKSVLLNKIKIALMQLDSGIKIILFGSRARGDSNRESDWDILILVDEGRKKDLEEQIRDAIFEIELETEQPISTLIYSKKEWDNLEITPLYQNVKSDGVML